jgi:hypothetical protein
VSEASFSAQNRGFEKNLGFSQKNGKKDVNILPLSIASPKKKRAVRVPRATRLF